MSTNNWTQWPWLERKILSTGVSNSYHGSPVEKSLKEKDSTDCNNGNNKRKANAIDNGDDSEDASRNATTVTLESVMAEIKNLNERSERIEDMLKSLFELAQKEDNNDKIEKEQKQEDEEKENEEKEDRKEEEEEDTLDTDTRQCNGKLNAFWLMRFEQLRVFKEKYGHCRVTRANKAHCDLGQWVVAQRSEQRTGRMTQSERKVEKLNTLGFDWSAQSTPKKSRTKR